MTGKRSFKKVSFGPTDGTTVITTPDGGAKGRVAVYARLTGSAGSGTLKVYGAFSSDPAIAEVQTINLGDIAAADTFKLTYNAHESALITYSTDMSAAIQAALVGLADFEAGDVVVTKTSLSVYVVTFGGAFANRDATAITITTTTGFTPVGVTETTKGGVGTEDVTDVSALGNPISEVVTAQENIYPYLTLVFDGDADPALAAEAYVVAF